MCCVCVRMYIILKVCLDSIFNPQITNSKTKVLIKISIQKNIPISLSSINFPLTSKKITETQHAYFPVLLATVDKNSMG